MPNQTPFFQAFGPLLFGRPARAALERLSKLDSLQELYAIFGDLFPQRLLSPTEKGANSRRRSLPAQVTSGNPLGQVVYTYDGNGNRASLAVWPGNASLNYLYTWRDQLKYLKSGATTLASYVYDQNGYVGNLTTRTVNTSPSTSTTYAYDAFDRVTWVSHFLNGTTRRFTYGYETDSNNRKWAQRDLANGDVFDYDLADHVSGVQLNIANPTTADPPNRTIIYDANGNRNWFTPYPPNNGQYFTNDLNQYTRRNTTNAAYDINGNLATGFDLSTYTYDAQNRLTRASTGGVTETFKYDGLNRQVSRKIGVSGTPIFSVYDGWDLVQEYQAGGPIVASYLHGATGPVKNLSNNRYYYQDGSGSTSHLASNTGNLLWWFRYNLQGAPVVYNSANNQISDSGFDLHLFTGQQWYSQLGLYDLRNRFYSPDIGRFLQPDPIGFDGDPTNLYRYCGNNAVKWSDPSGLQGDSEGWAKFTLKTEEQSTNRVWVFGGNGFPSALEHSLGGEGLLGNDPNSVRGDVGSFGDGGGGGSGGLGLDRDIPDQNPNQNPTPSPSQTPTQNPTPPPSPAPLTPEQKRNMQVAAGSLTIAGGIFAYQGFRTGNGTMFLTGLFGFGLGVNLFFGITAQPTSPAPTPSPSLPEYPDSI